MTDLKVGDKAPHFSAPDQEGKIHSLEDYKGRKLVLYFYPKDSTPGCTAQACNLRDNYEQLQSQGYDILGVSMDSAEKHKKFIEKQNLPFPLLVDEDRKIIDAYGVWGPKKFMGRDYEGIIRTTFVIDENSYIEEIIDKVKTKDHTSQILSSDT